jgi:O-antigen/teichoic acid export membrane protein
VLTAIAVEVVVVVLLQGWIARQLSLPNSAGVVLILVAAGIWILLCVDRGLLQAHRGYRALAGNLLMEGTVRTSVVILLVAGHLGVAGYAIGIFISEVVATVHAHWLARKASSAAPGADAPAEGYDAGADSTLVRRRLLADVSAAFVGLALLGLLQNVDVILLGRLNHAHVGPYAAISVASKALVFGALALGAYLLPEATIRWNEGGHAIRQLGVTLIFLAVPAALLLGISIFIPRWFLTLVFSAKLSSAAPAFAPLVAAMICLSFSVLVTNYLFGTGSRWIVLLLAAGSALAVGLIAAAHGNSLATARADLVVQGALALAMGTAFVGIHLRHRGAGRIPGRRWAPGAPVPKGSFAD